MMNSKDMKNNLANSLECHFPKNLGNDEFKRYEKWFGKYFWIIFPKNLGFRLATCQVVVSMFILE